ncbi:hypothetical protein DPMN_101159 [Dreissena polymorpha]|uniref:Uncharacterized protein n=1 Tax=Dreissena polymorpha TaxID=45954 RepID=A0A9D4H304_DREPO|nr:hypothetical protein DPMN_129560 [Dreissena polymorpha]KAH3858533.1 hypothetical protein DPMN_101159 [Dreissena polymorpha]
MEVAKEHVGGIEVITETGSEFMEPGIDTTGHVITQDTALQEQDHNSTTQKKRRK